jgi:hypothetical protein
MLFLVLLSPDIVYYCNNNYDNRFRLVCHRASLLACVIMRNRKNAAVTMHSASTNFTFETAARKVEVEHRAAAAAVERQQQRVVPPAPAPAPAQAQAQRKPPAPMLQHYFDDNAFTRAQPVWTVVKWLESNLIAFIACTPSIHRGQLRCAEVTAARTGDR